MQQATRRLAWQQQRAASSLSCCCCRAQAVKVIHSLRMGPAAGRQSVRAYSKASAAARTVTSGVLEGTSARPLESFFRQSFLARQLAKPDTSRPETVPDIGAPEATEAISSTSRSIQTTSSKSSDEAPPIATAASAWRPVTYPKTLRAQLAVYKQLAKGRLSAWVVLTAMAGYAMCPTDPAAAAQAMEALVQDTFGTTAISNALAEATEPARNTFGVSTLLATALGTGLCSASANTFNQLLEIPYDAQMPRTAKRPLPSHAITPLHAFSFGTLTGLAGCLTLWTCVNPLTASLGLLNIVLYAGVYTPLKRLSVINTWIGSIVGGIPPLMGWAACTNSLDPFSGQAGAWVLATILFAWQFPHFNALSWTIRSEYARGGYRMLSAVDPGMNARVSLRWTVIGAIAAAVGAPLVGLTSWTVGVASLVPSGALGLYAWRFWRAGSKASLEAAKQHGVMKSVPGARATDRDPRDPSARSLFFVSLVHLPALLFMMMAGKFFGDWWDKRSAEGEQEQQSPSS